jgi:hypothetical protein
LDLPLLNFDFFGKLVVVELAGGGVTAGSEASAPRDFLVN